MGGGVDPSPARCGTPCKESFVLKNNQRAVVGRSDRGRMPTPGMYGSPVGVLLKTYSVGKTPKDQKMRSRV